MFQGDGIAVLFKPAGMASQPDGRGDLDLISWSGLDAVPVGRLDRPVSGLVLCAISTAARRLLQSAQQQRRLVKVYRAKHTVPSVVLPQFMDSNWRWSRGRAHCENAATQGSKSAHLEVLAQSPDGLVELRLISGRRHQIRAQLSNAGAPLLGDRRYGGAPAAHLHLSCVQLGFPELPEGWREIRLGEDDLRALGLATPAA